MRCWRVLVARRRAVCGLLVLGSVAACLVSSLAVASARQDPVVVADSVVEVDAATGRVLRVVRVGPDPLLLTLAGGGVWTLNLGDGTLSRIDPGRKRSSVLSPGEAVGFASVGKDLWVAARGNRLLRVSGKSGRVVKALRVARQPVFASRDAGWVAVAQGSLWLTVPNLRNSTAPHTLWRIDAKTGKTVVKVPLPPNPLTPVVAGRSLWVVALDGGDTITRVDTRSNRARAIRVGQRPIAVTTGAGSLWVGLEGEDAVVRADLGTGRTIARVPVRGTVRGVAFGGRRLWVTTDTGLLAIDPDRNRVVRTVHLTEPTRDDGPIGVAYLNGSVWVSVE